MNFKEEMVIKEEFEIKDEFEINEELEIKEEFEIQEEIEIKEEFKIKEEFDPFQILNGVELKIKKENVEEASVPGSSTVFLDIEKQRMSADNFQIKCEPEMPEYEEIISNERERRSQQENEDFNCRHKKKRKVKILGGLFFFILTQPNFK